MSAGKASVNAFVADVVAEAVLVLVPRAAVKYLKYKDEEDDADADRLRMASRVNVADHLVTVWEGK